MTDAFIVGSSIAATIISLGYIGRAFEKAGRPSDVPFELIAIVIPVAYGIANIINVRLGNTISSAALTGAALGFLFSLGGRFLLHLPVKIFDISSQNAAIVHVIAPVLYALIFVVIVRQLNKLSLSNQL